MSREKHPTFFCSFIVSTQPERHSAANSKQNQLGKNSPKPSPLPSRRSAAVNGVIYAFQDCVGRCSVPQTLRRGRRGCGEGGASVANAPRRDRLGWGWGLGRRVGQPPEAASQNAATANAAEMWDEGTGLCDLQISLDLLQGGRAVPTCIVEVRQYSTQGTAFGRSSC